MTAPAKEGQAARSKTSSGTFEFARPSRFRFDYKKPFEQTIVADGQTLWLYDADLNQVTARKQSQVLASTPGGADRRGARPGRAAQATSTWKRRATRTACNGCRPRPRVKDGQLHSVQGRLSRQ